MTQENIDISQGEKYPINAVQQGMVFEELKAWMIYMRYSQLIKKVTYRIEVEYYPSEIDSFNNPKKSDNGVANIKDSVRNGETTNVDSSAGLTTAHYPKSDNIHKQNKELLDKDYKKGCGEWIESYYQDGDHRHREDVQCGSSGYGGIIFLCEKCRKEDGGVKQ